MAEELLRKLASRIFQSLFSSGEDEPRALTHRDLSEYLSKALARIEENLELNAGLNNVNELKVSFLHLYTAFNSDIAKVKSSELREARRGFARILQVDPSGRTEWKDGYEKKYLKNDLIICLATHGNNLFFLASGDISNAAISTYSFCRAHPELSYLMPDQFLDEIEEYSIYVEAQLCAKKAVDYQWKKEVEIREIENSPILLPLVNEVVRKRIAEDNIKKYHKELAVRYASRISRLSLLPRLMGRKRREKLKKARGLESKYRKYPTPSHARERERSMLSELDDSVKKQKEEVKRIATSSKVDFQEACAKLILEFEKTSLRDLLPSELTDKEHAFANVLSDLDN